MSHVRSLAGPAVPVQGERAEAPEKRERLRDEWHDSCPPEARLRVSARAGRISWAPCTPGATVATGRAVRPRERDLDLRRGHRCSVAVAWTSVPPGISGRLAYAWQATARPVAPRPRPAVGSAGTVAAQGDDTAVTLTASDIGDATATLTISGHTDGWWYRGQDSGTSQWGTCTAVAAGMTAVGISGLTAATPYDYTAYSDSTCNTKLAERRVPDPCADSECVRCAARRGRNVDDV